MFIGGTGASSDTTASDLGFRNVRQANEADNIVDASGNDLSGKLVGDLSGNFCNKHGKEVGQATIKDMVYTPRAGYNLFSLTKRLDDGWILGGDKNSLWISKGENKVVFDIKIKTPKGAIFATYFKRNVNNGNEVAAVMSDKKKKISADMAHGLVGHINDCKGRKNVKYLGYELTNKPMTQCGACAEAKAKH